MHAMPSVVNDDKALCTCPEGKSVEPLCQPNRGIGSSTIGSESCFTVEAIVVGRAIFQPVQLICTAEIVGDLGEKQDSHIIISFNFIYRV